MRVKLPPLNFLVTAEAISRCGSFTAAGAELNLTPSAVSHQIRSLERWLGFKIFDRTPKRVMVTEAGQRYLSRVSTLIAELESVTTDAVQEAQSQKTLRLQTTDSLASRWLVPRLPRFQEEHPLTTVQVTTYEYTEDFRASEADLAILWGDGHWQNHQSEPLLPETIFPVCHPDLIDGPEGAGFFSNQLLHDDNLGVTWDEWWDGAGGEVQGFGPVDFNTGTRFNHSHLALLAAESRHGIVLASGPLIRDSLRRGLLVAPFHYKHDVGCGYHVVISSDSDWSGRSKELINWLMGEAEASAL